MGRVAYGDESIRRSGVPDPVYLLGAYIADEDQFDLADALSVYVRQDGKLHWRDHTSRTKRVVCKTISEVFSSGGDGACAVSVVMAGEG